MIAIILVWKLFLDKDTGLKSMRNLSIFFILLSEIVNFKAENPSRWQ